MISTLNSLPFNHKEEKVESKKKKGKRWTKTHAKDTFNMQVDKDFAPTGRRAEGPERSPAGRHGDTGADETSVFLGFAVTDSCRL